VEIVLLRRHRSCPRREAEGEVKMGKRPKMGEDKKLAANRPPVFAY